MKRVFTLLTVLFLSVSFFSAYAQPGKPTLMSPTSGSTKVSLTANLVWSAVSGTDSFNLQIAKDTGFTTIVHDLMQNSFNFYNVPSGSLKSYTQYWWRVRGKNTGGFGQWSDTFSFRTIDTVAVPPTLISPSFNNQSSAAFPNFKWSAVPRASKYYLQLSTKTDFSTLLLDTSFGGGKTSYLYAKDTLKFDSTYYWRMRAENETGIGPWSAGSNFRVNFLPPTTPVLQSPANNAVNVPLTVLLDWAKSENADRYFVHVSTNPAMTDSVVKDTFSSNDWYQFSTDTLRLQTNSIYYWTISAGNAAKYFSVFSDTFHFTTSATTPPGRPTLTSPKYGSVNVSRTPTLTWTPTGTAATSYNIHISTFNRFSDTVLLDNSTVPTYTIPSSKKLDYNTVYYWRVRSNNDGGASPWAYFWNLNTLLGINSPRLDLGASIYPNPASGVAKVEFTLTENTSARISVVDITGREVLNVFSGDLAASRHSFDLNLQGIKAGTYYAVIATSQGVCSSPLVVQ